MPVAADRTPARWGRARWGATAWGAYGAAITVPITIPLAPRPARYIVSVRDANLNIVGQIDSYERLTLTRRFNAVGTWEMVLQPDHRAVPLLLANRAGILVQRDDVTIFSGPAWRDERAW